MSSASLDARPMISSRRISSREKCPSYTSGIGQRRSRGPGLGTSRHGQTPSDAMPDAPGDAKYNHGRPQKINVLFPMMEDSDNVDSDNIHCECDAYLDAHPVVETTSYKRRFSSVVPMPSHLEARFSFYSVQTIHEEPCKELCDDDNIGCFFQDYLHESKPLKIIRFINMREKEGTCWSSCVDKKGALLASFPELVESLPSNALDLLVTVQAKPRRPINPSECKLCATAIVGDYWGTQIRQVNSVEATEAELQRHNMHLVDSILQVAPVIPDDEQNLFYGQEDQISTEMKLGDILDETDLPFRVYVAQENIFSNRHDEEARESNEVGSGDGSDDDVSTTNNEVYITRDGR
ncbi:hypothetical protein THAOC_05321, partial [Thalassiosira oceanica]